MPFTTACTGERLSGDEGDDVGWECLLEHSAFQNITFIKGSNNIEREMDCL